MSFKLDLNSDTFNPLKLYDPRKPASRRTFYWLVAYPILVYATYFFVSGLLTPLWTSLDETVFELGGLLVAMFWVLALARRMLDRQRSRWLLLATLIPFIGWIVALGILIEAFFFPSVLQPTYIYDGDFLEAENWHESGYGLETEIS